MKKVVVITIVFVSLSCYSYSQGNEYDFMRIEDNSFLIEEAYNQESNVIQHISSFQYLAKTWIYTFTDEWPLRGQKHQISLTIPVLGLNSTGLGDIIINYRYQAFLRDRTAFSPRFSVLLPTGNAGKGLGNGVPGYQFNLPFSYIVSTKLVTHYNFGTTFTFAARNSTNIKSDITNINYGASVIYLMRPNFNFMLELVGNSVRTRSENYRVLTQNLFYINPGFRTAFNFRSGLQIVPGLAFPVGLGSGKANEGIFLYLSFEHPLKK